MKTIKSLLANSSDLYMALMSYRATPLPFRNLNPAELSIGHQIRTDVPQLKTAHIPSWPYLDNFRMKMRSTRQNRHTTMTNAIE